MSNNILDSVQDPIVKHILKSLLESKLKGISDAKKISLTSFLKDLNTELNLVGIMSEEKVNTLTRISLTKYSLNFTKESVEYSAIRSKLKENIQNLLKNSRAIKANSSHSDFESEIADASKRAVDRDFNRPTHCMSRKAFEELIAGWALTWPEGISQKAPAPDAGLLHRVCNRYPKSWVLRALKLITRDVWSTSQIRNPSSVLYSAAEKGWFRYFPEEPPLSCGLCGSVLASCFDQKCTDCRTGEQESAEAEAEEIAGQQNPEVIRALNEKIATEYGITIPGVCRVIKQHQRTDLLAFGLEGAARIISSDPHLRHASPGLPGCSTCKSRLSR